MKNKNLKLKKGLGFYRRPGYCTVCGGCGDMNDNWGRCPICGSQLTECQEELMTITMGIAMSMIIWVYFDDMKIINGKKNNEWNKQCFNRECMQGFPTYIKLFTKSKIYHIIII